MFHSIVEIFCLIIIFAAFLFAWNSRQFENSYLIVIGTALAPVGLIELLHFFSYKGYSLFPDYDANLPTSFWIASRYILASAFLIAPFVLKHKIPAGPLAAFWMFCAIILIVLIFRGDFPTCYIEGTGLTPFKIWSEYLISALFLIGLGALIRHKAEFDKKVLGLLIASILLMVVSELAFTSYFGVYDFANALGHVFMTAGFYCLYKGILETGIREPYNLLFRDLSEANQRWKTIFDNVHDAIFMHDLDGTILEVNEQMPKLYQVSREEATRFSISRDYSSPENSTDQLPAIWAKAVRGESQLFQWIARRPHSGEAFNVEVFLRKVRLKGRDLILANVRDITMRKKLENDLRAAIEIRDEFLSIASHELKTPLTALILQLQLTQKKLEKGSDPKGALLVQPIGQVKRITALLNELLDVTRIRSGNLFLEKTSFNLCESAQESIEAFRESASNIGSRITLDAPELIVGYWDHSRISQIFNNLLSNAIKYGGGGPIEIAIEKIEASDLARFSVRDYGIGIPKNLQANIFDRFERAVTGNKISGLGLGLYIVRQIVEAHGGSIRVESEPGKGTLFVCELPLRRA
ncbi:MAG: hypothetical protein A2070_02845 [Bdellovibrionales bacterium GWC1_52_8]|nr:MAG: hypothetical protein A2070_02845 [Bdellovibrionales bacterium GWC1_52_8]